jgi:lysophospholipase L1-like esterase
VSKLGLLLIAAAIAFSSSFAQAAKKEKVLFMGSSTVSFWSTLSQDFPNMETINVGVGGTTYGYLVSNAETWMRRYDVDKVVIYSGDNDTAWGSSPAAIAANFRQVARTIRSINPKAKVYVLAIKPCTIITRRYLIKTVQQANVLIKQEAQKIGVTYVDVHSPMLDAGGSPRGEFFRWDGIHMNDSGYRLWTRILRKQFATNTVSSAR